ncbi:MAG: DUF1566 domain-containing protein [Candidatus Electrothrix sp. LOE1_4_5]|nr:DUF1566 domain-containing protein [Candidatus Electrothrix gigas]MCI5194701.1 DUF1566 domain-containing protein [Candidatus Electrothrix gigas]
MKKIILLAGFVAGGVALSATAFANNWLLYLPAIISGKNNNVDSKKDSDQWLLFLPAILAGSQRGTEPEPPVGVTGALNDTGIVEGNSGTCVAGSGEDCNYGRDTDPETNSNDDGYAGFSFTGINSTCVLDNVTGLAWEVKTDDGGNGDKDNTYSWATATAYAQGFSKCGDTYTNCRLPTLKELLTIVSWGSYSENTPVYIDAGYFPNTVAATYLTSTEVANNPDVPSENIWGFDFSLGATDSAIAKISGDYRARAVCVAPTN